MPDEPPGDAASPDGAPASWQELAVARSLDSARMRAEERVQRFLDAAFELMDSTSSRDFTVQEVVERSGQSLRSFYQYFAGKYELLLALSEETVRATAAHLREVVAREEDPVRRLERGAIEYYRMCQPVPPATPGSGTPGRPTPALGEFAQELLTDHPREASRAFAPLVALFEELLEGAAAAGALRQDILDRRTVGVVLQAIMFNAFAATISGVPVSPDDGAAEELWDLLVHGLGPG